MNVLEKILEEIEHESKLAHEEMRKCASKNPLQFDETKGYARGVEYTTEIIRSHMNDADNDDWILVEEGLLEDERMVLVTYMTKSGIPSVDRARFDGKYWRGSGFMGRVIAWQPLPEPYKPKKDIQTGTEHIMSRFMTVE